MRLHWLRVTAFGPYRDDQLIDFDALGADGLFLLHGDTGAGKTTLLDAIAFALYGSVPGARNEAKRLRCDTADPDVVTRVAVELTVQGHRLRIERSPEYQRPKKRGGGFTTQQAKANLTWVNEAPSGQPAEGLTRIDEVGRTVRRLLGMSVEQFFQVVMLPQGEFARFLRADTAEREQLLEKLFGTQRFGDVEQWFSDLRRERKRELQEQGQHARELLARISQVASTEREADEDEQTWLEELEKRLTRELEDASSEHARLRRARDAAEKTLTERREFADKVRRVREAHAELADLDEHQDQHRAWRAEYEAAQRAVPVLTVRRGAVRAHDELERAVEELTVASARCTGVDTDSSTEHLRSLAGSHREQAGALQQLIPEAQQQESDQRRRAELASRIESDEQSAAELAEKQTALPEQITAARTRLDEAKQAATRLESLSPRVDELSALLRTARELPAAQQRLSEAEEHAREAVDRHQNARDRLQDTRARRLAGMAAELAGGLAANEPCPVCGSPEHPEPARPADGTVSADDEERAQADEQSAHTRREEAANVVQQARQTCQGLKERLGDRTETQLEAELTGVTAERDSLRDQAAQVNAHSDALAELEAAAERLTAQLGELRTRIATRQSEHRSLVETIQERENRLTQAKGDHDSVAAHREHLLDIAARIERLITARGARDDAQRRAEEQQDALERSAIEAGFTSVEAALAAERSDDRRTELTEALAEVDRRAAAARATLASAELFGVEPDAEIGLEEAGEAATAAREAAEQAAAVARSAEQRHGDVVRLAERLRAAWAELGPAQAGFAELDALTDVVNGRGQNARKMSLRSYVLAARLEEVAVVASRRLQRMSEGRYSFVHSDAAGARGTRGGLGLDVLDDYSGKVRPAKTLSGGESFLASLSLALGLADVVAAETGGALLDTLFIDEGFGTLDADTLDLVMDTLDDLRAGGRVVGLVSHVEEMRQRIAVRLFVRKARSGSTVEIEA